MSSKHLGLVGFFALSACAHPPTGTVAVSDEWAEYRSKHFAVDTDLTEDAADALVRDLEATEALVLQALVGQGAEIPGRIRVVALSNPSDFRQMVGGGFLHENSYGGYFTLDSLGEPVIVFPIAGWHANPTMVAHELAHHVAWFIFPRQPHWFAEGLAKFVETVARTDGENDARTGSHIIRGEHGGRRGRAGLAPPGMLDSLGPLVSAKALFSWNGEPDPANPGRYHLGSWFLYHWLWNKRSKQFTAFQERLANGEDPAKAWLAVFPEFDPATPSAMERLDDELAAYRRGGRYEFYHVKADSDGSCTRVPLSAADARAIRLDAWHAKAEEAAWIPQALEEILRADPTQPQAIVWRAKLRKESPLEALRKSVAARPEDWRAWLLFAEALPTGAEREAALRKAAALNPDSAQANNDLAWLLVESHRAKEALPFANRAVDLAPGNPSAVDTLGVVAGELGQCPQALTLEHRAIDLLGVTDGRRSALAKHLEDYSERCGNPAKPPDWQL